MNRLTLLVLLPLAACASSASVETQIETPAVPVEPAVGVSGVWVGGAEHTAFVAEGAEAEAVFDRFGRGQGRTVGSALALPGGGRLERIDRTVRYRAVPGAVVTWTEYRNAGAAPVRIDSAFAERRTLRPEGDRAPGQPPFWSFQAVSYPTRPDWVLPVEPGFARRNFFGMNASDYGGGTPLVDLWTPDGGVGVGHLALEPLRVAIPVRADADGAAHVEVVFPSETTLAPGEAWALPPTVAIEHAGDAFAALVAYRQLLAGQGIAPPIIPDGAYEPAWCAWGYGRDFHTADVLAALPKVVDLGFEWVTLDDGWQVAEGDWTPNPARFPRGDADLRAFVDSIHARDLEAMLWWAPMAADSTSALAREHPDWFLHDPDGSRRLVTWWDADYLCPAYAPVVEWHRDLTRRFIETYGFDGFKMDGQHLNAAPPCYNPAHDHERPEEAVEAVPALFEAIYEEAVALDPGAVLQFCPCGDAASVYHLPFVTQTVASDPTSSWQVRTKGWAFKALQGPSAPYYGDHVELSSGGDDFASSLGVGAVLGSKFTWAPDAQLAEAGWMEEDEPSLLLLTPEREAHWRHWLDLGREHDLARGTYLGGLYDVGFDRPEAHAIQKDEAIYVAFYADDFSGTVEVRGLEPGRTYQIEDYDRGRDYGTASGPTARLDVAFEHHLLLRAVPVDS